MKIAIVGAGAMGCLYGGRLSELPDIQVYLIDPWQEHMEQITKQGLIIDEHNGFVVEKKLNCCTSSQEIGVVDLVILFVKSTLTEIAIRENQCLFNKDTIVLTLQNGLGNIEKISQVLGDGNVIAGTTAQGATMVEAGHIRHGGSGKTIIGELSGEKTHRIIELQDILKKAGFDTEISKNVIGLVWDKLLINVAINPLSAITKLKNGQLLEHEELVEIMELAFLEAQEIAFAKGIQLTFTDNSNLPFEHVKQVAKATAQNQSSMLQDMNKGRLTEIHSINGAVVDIGREVGIATPVNQVLTNLVLLQEKISRQHRKEK